MVEGEVTTAGLEHTALPFRMANIEPALTIPTTWPFSVGIQRMVTEFTFQYRLLRSEWDKRHYMLMLFGAVAFLLGSLSPEISSGGDATLAGMEGITSISGFQFFQILISILLWSWFLYQAVIMFPIMRVHTVSLLIMWNIFMASQVFYHQNNPTFPLSINPADMMSGTLLVMVAGFFLYFFWKAVVETRDLHVEVHHLHEDVRVMEAEMAEHSLMAWSWTFIGWLALVITSTWAGVHHVSTYGEQPLLLLILHVSAGLASIPTLLIVLWFPQRMLGGKARIRTKAALQAEQDLSLQTGQHTTESGCPECAKPVPLTRSEDGTLHHPCMAEGCSASVAVGTACSICSKTMPTRISCPSCGVNAPAMDYMPDQEAW
ncbi:MAG: hypothetical protein DWC07_07650 [Candidatus Poseidoniales archaeon]|nr:MAG: hypothetical protein DWC07_07650 [Candidatus Poseidoniales archaeon]